MSSSRRTVFGGKSESITMGENMRRLDDHFRSDLKHGALADLTKMVRSDTSLCLELRGQSINIYYRGGSLMKVEKKSLKKYTVFFDPKYFMDGRELDLPECNIGGKEGVEKWLEVSPRLKQAMDCYFGKHPADEREFQQLLVRDNNFGSIAKSTDYYICDIEYSSDNGRFDMIAVHWPSTASERKKEKDRRLVLVEVKHGDGSLTGTAGLCKHISDVNKYLENPEHVRHLKTDMVHVFNQKLGLCLIKCANKLCSFSDEKPIFLLVLANHDPESSKLRNLLHNLPDSPNAELRIATASFLGYGLYEQGVHTVEAVESRFGDYIYSKESLSP